MTTTTQMIGDAKIPLTYEVWRDGVYKLAEGSITDGLADVNRFCPQERRKTMKKIAVRPFWVMNIGRTVDTREPLVALMFDAPGGVRETLWCNRQEIAETRLLTQLARDGVPVDGANARELIVYLRYCEQYNADPARALEVAHRTGHHAVNGQHGWLLGRRWIGPPGTHLAADPRIGRNFVDHYGAEGDLDEWIAMWRKLSQESWSARWIVSATFASPLLRWINCRTFLLHHWTGSGAGKTSLAKFSMSAWGNPNLLSSSMNRTEVSATEVFKHLDDLPVLFDEKQVAAMSISKLIYSVVLEVSRARGARTGGLRDDTVTWRLIARTTGEEPLINGDDLGGQTNRVLQVNAPGFADPNDAPRVYDFIDRCYGHAGWRFLQKLTPVVNMPDGIALLRTKYEALKHEVAGEKGAVLEPYVGQAAAVGLGEYLALQWLLGMDREAAWAWAVKDSKTAYEAARPARDEPLAERALQILQDHVLANPGLYPDMKESANGSEKGKEEEDSIRSFRRAGWKSTKGMTFIPTEANEVLEEHGLPWRRVWSDFAERGWLVRHDDEHLTIVDTFKKVRARVYRIKPGAFSTRNVFDVIEGGAK